MAARNYDDNLVATDSIFGPGADGFPDGSDEYHLFRDAINHLQNQGVMPDDSLQKFEDAVTEGDGFIDWKSIDKSWETYEVALRNVVDCIFYGSNASDAQLRTFYDKIDEINQARQEVTGHSSVKAIWECLWNKLQRNFSYLEYQDEGLYESNGYGKEDEDFKMGR